jgi:hypothetical protein
MDTTTMTTPDLAKEAARVHALRLAMCEWRADPVGGSTRLIKDIAREHSAPDPVMTLRAARLRKGPIWADSGRKSPWSFRKKMKLHQ